MLTGETRVDGGELAFEKGTRVALHDQRPPLERKLTLREYVLDGARDLVAAEEELRGLESAMAAGDHGSETLAAYSAAQARLEHAGGYGWRDHATSVVRGLGFSDDDLDRSLRTFSGGELTRASLARALAGDPDLLLLDEPTNHLDVTSIEWLERELASLDAAVILVAHDRWFLEAVTNATLELEAGRAIYFAGPWHAWRREKAERAQHAAKTAERISVDIERLERFVARFRYKKSKAKQAQAKLTQISRLEKERSGARAEHDAPDPPLQAARLRLRRSEAKRARSSSRSTAPRSRPADRELLHDVSLALERGEHVAFVGPTGRRKTTLLERIVADDFKLGYGVELGYFPQQEVHLDARGSILDCMQAMTGLTRPRAQSLLGRFLFSGWEAHEKPVTALSGGERRRLGLAVLVASGANFLILDEPTNHLDLDSREALEAALEAFPGTVLLVSHDRALLDAVAHRTAAVEDGTVRVYDGGWADYLRAREERQRLRLRSRSRRKRRSRGRRRRSRADEPLELLEREIEEQGGAHRAHRGASSPRTGPMRTRSPRTARPARSCRASSRAGSGCWTRSPARAATSSSRTLSRSSGLRSEVGAHVEKRGLEGRHALGLRDGKGPRHCFGDELFDLRERRLGLVVLLDALVQVDAAGVRDEVRDRDDSPRGAESRPHRRIGDVRSRRDDSAARRARRPPRDRVGAGAGDEHVGFQLEELLARPCLQSTACSTNRSPNRSRSSSSCSTSSPDGSATSPCTVLMPTMRAPARAQARAVPAPTFPKPSIATVHSSSLRPR